MSGLRVRSRRVTVKARVVKLAGAKAQATAAAHLRYLERDGVSRDGEQGRFYSTFADDADGKAFLERGEHDRHQFRFIVSPEDGASFQDLRTFTRDLMVKMEQDLGTTLDWVAVDHFDTGHPHTHILLRGATEDGRTLNIAGDYIAHGIRGRASEIMTKALGPQSELEVREQLAREIGAERLTRLDRSILERAQDVQVDLREKQGMSAHDREYQQLLVGRMRQLEKMELATRDGPLVWSLRPDVEQTLADLGRRGDIIRTMHHAMTQAKLERRPELYAVYEPAKDPPVIGKVLHRGTGGDYHDRSYVILDGIDGQAHYVDVGSGDEYFARGSIVRIEGAPTAAKQADRTIAEIAAANGGEYSVDIHLRHDPHASEEFAAAHVRRLEAIRRATAAVERRADGTWRIPTDYLDQALKHERDKQRSQPVRLQLLSPGAIESQQRLPSPTWLDEQLRSSTPLELAQHGFGKDLRDALLRRQQWLIAEGFAERRGDKVLYQTDMEAVLRQSELRTAAARFSKELGLQFTEVGHGDEVRGVLNRRVDLRSGSYALIEKSKEFTLVPWRPVLERRIGREISGRVRDSGTISWSFGRERKGPEIGM